MLDKQWRTLPTTKDNWSETTKIIEQLNDNLTKLYGQYKIDQDRIAEKNQQIERLESFVRYVNEHAEKNPMLREHLSHWTG